MKPAPRRPSEAIQFNLFDPRACAEQSARLAAEITEPVLWTAAAAKVAGAYYKLGDFASSQAMFDRIIEFVRRVPQPTSRATSLFTVAEGLGEVEQGPLAEQVLQEGLALLNYVDEGGRTSSALRTIAVASATAAEGAGQLEEVQKSLDTTERIVDNNDRVAAVCAIAATYANIGRPDLARRALEEALSVAQRIQEDYYRAVAYAQLAGAADEMGARAWAFDMVKIALETSRAVLDPYYRTLVSSHLAFVLFYMGEETSCEEYVLSGLQAALAVSSPVMRARAVGDLASALFRIGRVDQSAKLLGELYDGARSGSAAESPHYMSSLVRSLAAMSAFPGEVQRKIRNASLRIRFLDREEREEVLRHLHHSSEQLAHGRFSLALRTLRLASFQIQRFELKEKEVLEQAKNELFVLEASIGRLKEAGVEVADIQKSWEAGKAKFDKKEFAAAIKVCKEIGARIEELKKTVRPKVSILLPDLRMAPHAWTKVDVALRNEGGMKCVNVRLKFDGPIEVHAPEGQVELKAGEERTLPWGIYPREPGTLPVKMMLRFEDLEGNLYTEEKELWVEAQGSPGLATATATAPAAPRAEVSPAAGRSQEESQKLAEVLLGFAAPAEDSRAQEVPPPPPVAAAAPSPPPSAPPKAAAPGPARTFRIPRLKPVKKDEAAWKEASSGLDFVERMYDGVVLEPKALFELAADVIEDWNFHRLAPKINETSSYFRALSRFYAEADGVPFAVHVEVAGSGVKSRVILRAFAPGEHVEPLAEFVESELSKRFDISGFRQ
jgi:tetratricopeptide (TPR) repeat protein